MAQGKQKTDNWRTKDKKGEKDPLIWHSCILVQPHEKSIGLWGFWSSSPLATGQLSPCTVIGISHWCQLVIDTTVTWLSSPDCSPWGEISTKAGAQLPCPFLLQQPDTRANAAVGSTAWLIAPGAPCKPESSPLPANPCAIAVVPHVITHTAARKWRITASLCKKQLPRLLWISKHNQAYFLIICKCTFEIWMHLLDWGTHKKQTMKTVKLQDW